MKIDPTVLPSPTGIDEHTQLTRAISTARRLLSGSGRASVLAYRTEPQLSLDAVAHGTLPDGTLVVAACLDDETRLRWLDEGSADVRFDVQKDSPDPAVLIRASSLHLLGVLRWADAIQVGWWLAEDALPGAVAALAGLPNTLVCTISAPRVLLYDGFGVTALTDEQLAVEPWAERAFPDALDEFSAYDVVADISQERLLGLVEGVLVGRVAGVEQSFKPASGICPHLIGTVRCVDIDANGLTLMHLSADATATFFVAFDEPARSLVELSSRVAAVLSA